MPVYNLYIFDRYGACLYYSEWNRRKHPGMSKEEEFKLMFGMMFSIKSFIHRISPSDMKDGFLNFKTNIYKLHFYETPSGIKVIMLTDLNVGNIRDILHQIYSSLYVEYVVKNPLCSLNKPITSELFKTKVDEFVQGLSIYAKI